MDLALSLAVICGAAVPSSSRNGLGQNLSRLAGLLFALINGSTIFAAAALTSPNKYSSWARRSSKCARIARKKSAGRMMPHSMGDILIGPSPMPFSSR